MGRAEDKRKTLTHTVAVIWGGRFLHARHADAAKHDETSHNLAERNNMVTPSSEIPVRSRFDNGSHQTAVFAFTMKAGSPHNKLRDTRSTLHRVTNIMLQHCIPFLGPDRHKRVTRSTCIDRCRLSTTPINSVHFCVTAQQQ